jgi:hypothetical protein
MREFLAVVLPLTRWWDNPDLKRSSSAMRVRPARPQAKMVKENHQTTHCFSRVICPLSTEPTQQLQKVSAPETLKTYHLQNNVFALHRPEILKIVAYNKKELLFFGACGKLAGSPYIPQSTAGPIK